MAETVDIRQIFNFCLFRDENWEEEKTRMCACACETQYEYKYPLHSHAFLIYECINASMYIRQLCCDMSK